MESPRYVNRCTDCGNYVENCFEQDSLYVCYACVKAYKLKVLNEANAVAAIRGNRAKRRKQQKQQRKLIVKRKQYGTSPIKTESSPIPRQQTQDLEGLKPEVTGAEEGSEDSL